MTDDLIKTFNIGVVVRGSVSETSMMGPVEEVGGGSPPLFTQLRDNLGQRNLPTPLPPQVPPTRRPSSTTHWLGDLGTTLLQGCWYYSRLIVIDDPTQAYTFHQPHLPHPALRVRRCATCRRMPRPSSYRAAPSPLCFQ